MEIQAYNKTYLPQISDTVGTMFEYAITSGIDPIIFWNTFINSSIAKEIEKGNIVYLNSSAHSSLKELYPNLKIKDFILKICA